MRVASFFKVVERTGPTSSFSGKNTSMASTFFSCAINTIRGVISSFDSRITSPVSGSTISVTVKAPSSSDSAIATVSKPASLRPSIALRVNFLSFLTTMSVPGTLISAPAFFPFRLSFTLQSSDSPLVVIRSTV